MAFLVDFLLGAQEMVVKSLPPPLVTCEVQRGGHHPGHRRSGGDAECGAVTANRRTSGHSPGCPHGDAGRRENVAPVILVVDDSITTRTLEKNILQMAGYQVQTAADGAEALALLRSAGCAPTGTFALVVSDVSMPRLDGFELTAQIRADERLKDLPVILVTSLDAQEERTRGIQAGADAYILKGAFDQEGLLATVRRLV